MAQADLSTVENAASSINLTSTANLFNASNVGSFTLDLADSQFFYGANNLLSLQLLNGENPINSGSLTTSYIRSMTSFGRVGFVVIIFSGDQWFLAIRNLTSSNSTFNIGAITFMTNQLYDVRMFRKSFQPLPGKDHIKHNQCILYVL